MSKQTAHPIRSAKRNASIASSIAAGAALRWEAADDAAPTDIPCGRFTCGTLTLRRDALRDALTYANIEQADLGDALGVSQGTVSRDLRAEPMPMRMRALLGSMLDLSDDARQRFADDALDRFRMSVYAAVSLGKGCAGCITNPETGEHLTSRVGDPDLDGVGCAPGMAPREVRERGEYHEADDYLPRIRASAAPADAFDVDAAMQVMDIIHRAREAGETGCTFGTRKAVLWARSYAAFRAAGWTHPQALATGYDVAVSGREYGAERTTLIEAYAAVMREPAPGAVTLPALDPDPAGAILHPLLGTLRPLLDAPDSATAGPMHIYIQGDTGCGKTYAVMDEMKRRGVEPMRINLTRDTREFHLLGSPGYVEGVGTVWNDGPLALAMQRGVPLIIDEVCNADAGVLSALQAVLEGAPLILAEDGGRRIDPAEGFRIIACDNSLGLGEATAYVGLQPLNESFRDRFVYIVAGRMPTASEAEVIRRALAG